ncbi:hypothetical protein [Melittangium boletus]|uniref:Pentapeptide repeat-containing protein n=1 Tax=Melittangium boletus DSM 14713 TaxID=1294270 RepID=A0A250IGD5_9BACT|nr:hypothetical protein [Melittangium boletus]ATB30889.1 hypothetical protein MEBOL_004351 [Melittangium boletus DSM 14713]
MLKQTIESRRGGGELRAAGWVGWTTLALMCAVACGPAEGSYEEQEALASTAREVEHGNGLNLNGLNLNGLNLNGLNLNGLNLNGLSTQDFASWFQVDRALRAEVMKYVVACAVPAGESRTFTDTSTGTSYRWDGLLGLAPSWSGGEKATDYEQQVVSACMAAHSNKFGIHVTISLRGLDGAGNVLPVSLQEDTNYSVREACFFGNLFDGETGVFGGNDGLTLASNQSSPRVCGLPGVPTPSQCLPMVFVGSCSTYCTPDATNSFYTSCSYGGKTYRPLATRMKTTDIYTCGNGVCESAEVAGMPSYCAADCG